MTTFRRLAFVAAVAGGLAVAGWLANAAADTDVAAADRLATGAAIWRKADCGACHASPGSSATPRANPAAPPLHLTRLGRDALEQIIRCGRPGSDMPHYDRFAYSGQRCPTEIPELGYGVPVFASPGLQPGEISALAEFLDTSVRASAELTLQECRKDAPTEWERLCDGYPAAAPGAASSAVEVVRPGDGHLGAGVQVSPRIILTASHVVRDETRVRVVDDQGRERPANVIANDAGLDLALVRLLDRTEMAVSPVMCAVPAPGRRVSIIGHPAGKRFTVLGGRIDSLPMPFGQWRSLVLLSQRALGGMSGGPVIDGNGAVIAMVVAATRYVDQSDGPAGAVPGNKICEFLMTAAPSICDGHTCGGMR